MNARTLRQLRWTLYGLGAAAAGGGAVLLARALTKPVAVRPGGTGTQTGASGQVSVPTQTISQPITGRAFSQALAATGGSGYYLWSVASGALPAGLVLSPEGVLSGTPTVAGAYHFTVQVTDEQNTLDVATARLKVTVAQAVAIPVQPLGAVQVGVVFAHQWQATGGSGSYTWDVVAGSLPAGLGIHSTGLMAGTPTAPGTYTFTVQATDEQNSKNVARRDTTVVVRAQASDLTIPEQALGTIRVGVPFSHTWTSSGGIGAITWTVDGDVPPGLLLSSGGLMAGTPTAAGSYRFAVHAADSTGKTVGRSTDVTVLPASASTSTSLGGQNTTSPGTIVYSSGSTGTPGSTTVTDVSGGTAGQSGSVDLQVTQTSPTGQTTSQVYNVQTSPTGQTSINLKYSSLNDTTSGSATSGGVVYRASSSTTPTTAYAVNPSTGTILFRP